MISRKYWSSEDLKKFKKFIKSKADILLPIFYQNIQEGNIKVRKPNGFYRKMGEFLGRTPLQCKSKFQKFEKDIYTKYLGVPARDFMVFHLIQNNPAFRSKIEKTAFETERAVSPPVPEKMHQKRGFVHQIYGKCAEMEGPDADQFDPPNPEKTRPDPAEEDLASVPEDLDGGVSPIEHWKQVIKKIQDGQRYHGIVNKNPGKSDRFVLNQMNLVLAGSAQF